jgi:hypothetical protein
LPVWGKGTQYMTNQTSSSLASRIEDFAREMEDERARLEQAIQENDLARTHALNDMRKRHAAEREAMLAEYAEKGKEARAQLALAERLRRTLNGNGSKPATTRRAPTPNRKKKGWTPSAESKNAALHALASGADTQAAISEIMDMSTSGVSYVLDAAREDGHCRLSGKRGNAKLYAITPQGEAHLQSLESGE